jgi:hypothetical protein
MHLEDRDKLYRAPMQVRHGFASNELFRLDRLVELARSCRVTASSTTLATYHRV